jgi:undecaprenyl-diphosphatase
VRSRERWIRAGIAVVGLAVFAAMAHAVENGETLGLDLRIRAAVHDWACPALTVVMRLITALGSGYFLVPFAIIPVWWLAMRGERLALWVFVAGSLSAQATSELLKVLFHRPRPEVFFNLVPAETYSFPSGHSFVPAVYFGLLAVILARGAGARAGVIVLAGLLGLSRVYLGYHYPSDVLAGWALAAVWLALWAGPRQLSHSS